MSRLMLAYLASKKYKTTTIIVPTIGPSSVASPPMTVALDQAVKPGGPALNFNYLANFLMNIGCHFCPPFFDEAAGLLTKNPGILPGIRRLRQPQFVARVASLEGFEPTTRCLEGKSSKIRRSSWSFSGLSPPSVQYHFLHSYSVR